MKKLCLKTFFIKIGKNIKNFFKNIWNYIVYIAKHPQQLIVPVLCAEIIFWIPIWVPALLAITVSPWWWTVVAAVNAFWWAPCTPATLLQIGLITLFERIWNRILKKIKEKKKNGK